MIWQADGRITLRWSSAEAQRDGESDFPYLDSEAVFPVDVMTDHIQN